MSKSPRSMSRSKQKLSHAQQEAAELIRRRSPDKLLAGQMNGQTDERTDRVITIYPPFNFIEGGLMARSKLNISLPHIYV